MVNIRGYVIGNVISLQLQQMCMHWYNNHNINSFDSSSIVVFYLNTISKENFSLHNFLSDRYKFNNHVHTWWRQIFQYMLLFAGS